MTTSYKLGITSVDAIQLYPDWDYTDGEKITRSEHRTRSGNYYQYKWNDYKRIAFKTSFVNSSNASIVNSWWDSQTTLIWFKIDGATVDCTSVMIMNNEQPFQTNVKPYTEYWQGVIELEEYLGA